MSLLRGYGYHLPFVRSHIWAMPIAALEAYSFCNIYSCLCAEYSYFCGSHDCPSLARHNSTNFVGYHRCSHCFHCSLFLSIFVCFYIYCSPFVVVLVAAVVMYVEWYRMPYGFLTVIIATLSRTIATAFFLVEFSLFSYRLLYSDCVIHADLLSLDLYCYFLCVSCYYQNLIKQNTQNIQKKKKRNKISSVTNDKSDVCIASKKFYLFPIRHWAHWNNK